jgi:hypothetical protein
VNVTRYALGVVVSTTCLVTGVLWYDRVNPDIRAEDVAACIAAGVERKWVTDWATPPTNTVTSTIKGSDLVQAATLLRAAIANADVIYLDPGTWSDGGLDMAYSLAFTNDPAWRTTTNFLIGTEYELTIGLQPPESVFVNGVALADKAATVTVITNSFSITTNQAYEIHTNLVIVSQTTTTGPDWTATGRPNGTVFYWNGTGYTNIVDSWPLDYFERPQIGLNQHAGVGWETWYIEDYTYWGWSTYSDSPVGTYTAINWSEGQTGSVVIAWHSSTVETPLITTTNITTSTYGGTNMPLYAALGTPANLASWAGLIGGTNSWWAYAGFGALPYWLQDVETASGRGRYTIETKNLTQIRSLATNMVRTVDFDFAVTGTVRVLSATSPSVTNYYYARPSSDIAAGYAAAYNYALKTETTNAVTAFTGVMAKEDSFVQNAYISDYDVTAGIYFFVNMQYSVQTTLPAAAFSNGYISRLRVYVAAETRSPYNYWPYTNSAVTYYALDYNENKTQKYGWTVDFGTAPEFELPHDLPWTNSVDLNYSTVGYLTTNQTWTLVFDIANPVTNPVIILGPDDLIHADYFQTVPVLNNELTDRTPTWKNYSRLCETRITHSALVIDWDFKLFGSTPYVPIETNRPAWMP